MWTKKRKWRPKTVRKRSVCHPNRLLRGLSFFLPLLLAVLSLGPSFRPANAAPSPQKLKLTDPYALIFGTVWGPDNRPVYGVKVLIRRDSDKKPKWELYSDHRGEFAQRVLAGKNDYVVGANLKGIKTEGGRPLHLAEEVPVHIEYDERVDIGLHLAQ
jgi:hypothetical protein